MSSDSEVQLINSFVKEHIPGREQRDVGTLGEHCLRMRQELGHFLGKDNLPKSFELTCYVHDFVSDTVAIGLFSKKFYQQYCEFLGFKDSTIQEEALALSVGMQRVEGFGEEWRSFLLEEIEAGLDLNSISRTQIVEQDYTELADSINSMATKQTKLVHPDAFSIRMPRNAIENYIQQIESLGPLPFIFKAVEMLDNLTYPPNNQAAAWRDAQEVISYLGPIMEVLGQDHLARELQGVALEYLNLNNPYVQLSKVNGHNLIEYAIDSWERIESENEQMQYILGDMQRKFRLLGIIPDLCSQRPKTLGSILEKMFEKRYLVPDGQGIELVFSDYVYRRGVETVEEVRFNDYMDKIVHVVELMDEYGYVPMHTKDPMNEQQIEIFAGNADTTQRQRLVANIAGHDVEILARPKTETGYEAAHLSFYNAAQGVSLEVKVKYVSDWEHAKYGGAAHIFYKNAYSIGSNLEELKAYSHVSNPDKLRYDLALFSIAQDLENIYKNTEKMLEKVLWKRGYIHIGQAIHRNLMIGAKRLLVG